MNNNTQPIGIFDSGVGGLTVYKELKKLLPNESFVYFGDTARVPYGTKSRDIVIKYALNNSLFLMEHNVKLIVVACNTASAVALNFLQSRLKTPVMGVIEPGATAALEATKNKHIGVIGTEGTIKSGVYEQALKKADPNVICYSKPTALFVPIIEEGVLDKNILNPVFDYYLKDFINQNIDTIILGCTHYPILRAHLKEYLNNNIELVDSAKTTASQVKKLLSEQGLLNQSATRTDTSIYFSDTPKRVKRIARSILEKDDIIIHQADF